jgi:hypothetical protein
MKGDFVRAFDSHHIRVDVQQAAKEGAKGVVAAYVPEQERVVYNIQWQHSPPV